MNTKWLLVVVVLVSVPAAAADIGLQFNEVTIGIDGDPVHVDYYRAFWKLASSGEWVESQSQNVPTTSCDAEKCRFVMLDLPSSTQVDIRVHAYNIGGESGPSNTLRVGSVVRPAAPTGLTLWIP